MVNAIRGMEKNVLRVGLKPKAVLKWKVWNILHKEKGYRACKLKLLLEFNNKKITINHSRFELAYFRAEDRNFKA